ncbi:MAG: hypothetical protein ACRDIL_17345, partial [Candidatus Limnocylindrales bacterium]
HLEAPGVGDQAGSVHLVGSVPLPEAGDVFRTVSKFLGPYLRRLPDGEQVTKWIGSQISIFAASPELEPVEAEEGRYSAAVSQLFRLREGVAPADVSFGPLGYARVARDSFDTFTKLKAEGVIPEHLRFQVSLPTPLASIAMFCKPSAREVFPAYEAAMMREVDEIVDAVPHGELAMQWDVAVEMGILEDFFTVWFGNDEAEIVRLINRACSRVPVDVPLGLHLCYGDAGHKHWKEPTDMGKLTSLANAVLGSVDRPIAWLHMPVPRDRTDLEYFAPLRHLRPLGGTELYLGLVHRTDGLDGARARMKAAQSVVEEFGVGTECGLGRRPPETIPDLLQLHAEVADIARTQAS